MKAKVNTSHFAEKMSSQYSTNIDSFTKWRGIIKKYIIDLESLRKSCVLLDMCICWLLTLTIICAHDVRVENHQGPLDSRMRTRTSTRFDCPFSAKILRELITRTINLTHCQQYRLLSHCYCWQLSLFADRKKSKAAPVFLTCFDTTTFFAKPRRHQVFPAKMTLVYLRALSVVL